VEHRGGGKLFLEFTGKLLLRCSVFDHGFVVWGWGPSKLYKGGADRCFAAIHDQGGCHSNLALNSQNGFHFFDMLSLSRDRGLPLYGVLFSRHGSERGSVGGSATKAGRTE